MQKTVSESKLNMWRAIVALVHADGHKHPNEDQFLKEQFQNIPFSEEQLAVLNSDIESPKEVSLFYDGITEPADRSQFIYFARLLFWSDGDFASQEEAILKRFHGKTLDKANLEKVMHSVDQIAVEFETQKKNRGFREILADVVGRIFE